VPVDLGQGSAVLGPNHSSRLSGLFGSSTRTSYARNTNRRLPLTEMVPWTAAHFPSEDARDRFLGVVATLPSDRVEGAPMEEQDRSALIRWRPGHFLGLNDIAYAHGGRIILVAR
jgi:hypothetical protein